MIGPLLVASTLAAGDPPVINPFGRAPSERDDAVPGILELSDGTHHSGLIYLTRDKRLQIFDQTTERQREIPLQAVKTIECHIKKEWTEKEWRFKEGANDEKLYTGRSYPAREYSHTITLKNGKTITGPLSTIVYVQPPQFDAIKPGADHAPVQPEQFLLSKRNKGEMGEDLKSLLYVKRISLGKEAVANARKTNKNDSTTKE
jgi:hypothetical protein